MGLMKTFQQVDLQRTEQVSMMQVKRVFKDIRVELSDHEMHVLWLAYQEKDSQLVDYVFMVEDLRGTMSPPREQLVTNIFYAIDADMAGHITIQQILSFLAPRNHPDVKNGKKSLDDVLQDFQETLQLFHLLKGNQYDVQLSLPDFLAYFHYFSGAIQDDALFDTIVAAVFKVYHHSNVQKSAGINRQ